MAENLELFDKDNIENWIFDLDNTIYPANSSLFPRVAERMTLFISKKLDLPVNKASELKTNLFRKYGTTLKGLMLEYSMDPEEFLFFVHEIDLSDVKKDFELDKGISNLNGKKYIFTNGTTRHADRILKKYGIEKHFEDIFDIVDADYIPKPNFEPYKIFLKKFKIDPTKSVMIEDMAKNLEPAAKLGIKTIWLKSDHEWASKGASDNYIHFVASDLKSFLTKLK